MKTMAEKLEELKKSEAKVARLPYATGDGYGYGGGVVLVIGDLSFNFGEREEAGLLALEVAYRWNELRGQS